MKFLIIVPLRCYETEQLWRQVIWKKEALDFVREGRIIRRATELFKAPQTFLAPD
jgi:hypothetical protein